MLLMALAKNACARIACARIARLSMASVVALSATLTLSGCSSLAPLPKDPKTQEAPVAADQSSAQYAGRFSMVVTGDRPESISGRFTLTTSLLTGVLLELYSPFGQLQARLQSTSKQAKIELADGGVRVSESEQDDANLADKLLLNSTGIQIPVASLTHWISLAGQKKNLNNGTNSNEKLEFDTNDRLISASASGWQASVDRWTATNRPKRLILNWSSALPSANQSANPAQPARDLAKEVQIRIFIDEQE
jgi:outer membrane biogenesis lipoprotein LolB